MEAYNDTITQLGLSEGVRVIDLASKIPKTLDNFVDDVHYPVEGARLVGTIVAGEIEPLVRQL